MMLQRFTCIPHLLSSIRYKKRFGDFPDDILIDILSRLPADSILQCRRVCKHWQALTFSTSFLALQHTRAPTVILLQCNLHFSLRHSNLHFYGFDKNLRKLKKVRFKSSEHTLREHNVKLVGSFGGLLLFGLDRANSLDGIIALNIITKEVRLLPWDISNRLCGLFFHPSASEYKYLNVYGGFDDYRYYLTDYASEETKRIACSPPSCYFRPDENKMSPAIVNLALHWIAAPSTNKLNGINPCMHAVMVFKMDTEDLFTLPHPGINCTSSAPYHDHRMMRLFVNDEHLCLGHVRARHGNIYVWILEDYANWNWIRRYNIEFFGVAKDIPLRYYSSSYHHRGDWCYKINILGVQKNKVLIDWFSCGLYLIDLNRKIARKIDVPRIKMNGYTRNTYICVAYTSSIATPSLFSTNHN